MSLRNVIDFLCVKVFSCYKNISDEFLLIFLSELKSDVPPYIIFIDKSIDFLINYMKYITIIENSVNTCCKKENWKKFAIISFKDNQCCSKVDWVVIDDLLLKMCFVCLFVLIISRHNDIYKYENFGAKKFHSKKVNTNEASIWACISYWGICQLWHW